VGSVAAATACPLRNPTKSPRRMPDAHGEVPYLPTKIAARALEVPQRFPRAHGLIRAVPAQPKGSERIDHDDAPAIVGGGPGGRERKMRAIEIHGVGSGKRRLCHRTLARSVAASRAHVGHSH